MSYINPPSDEILEVIRKHFAKEYGVNPGRIEIDSIESYKNDEGDLEYYLNFTIDWYGSYEEYWGEITHNEVIEDMRDNKLNSILKYNNNEK